MSTPLITIHVIVCIAIIFLVLLQVGRGAEAGAAFGGTGQVQTTRGQVTFAGKLTTALAVAFMLTSFMLTYTTSNRSKSSVIERVNRTESLPAAPSNQETGAETKAPGAETDSQTPAPSSTP